jgi:hypothetical protein
VLYWHRKLLTNIINRSKSEPIYWDWSWVGFVWLFSENEPHWKYVKDLSEKKTNTNYQNGTSGLIGTFRNVGERKWWKCIICIIFLDIVHRPVFIQNKVLFIFQNSVSEIRFSLRNVVLKNKQEGVLDKNRPMDDVLNHNICANVSSSQTCRCYYYM